MRLLNDNVCLKRIKEETKSGIILSTENKTRNDIGEVVGIADNIDEIKVGDKVIYSKFAGTSFKLGEEEHLIVNINDIIAVKE